MAADNTIALYDLQVSIVATISPFVCATKYAVRDLFGGLGRHPGLFHMHGLEQREGDPAPFVRLEGKGGIFKRNTGPASTRAETKSINRQGA